MLFFWGNSRAAKERRLEEVHEMRRTYQYDLQYIVSTVVDSAAKWYRLHYRHYPFKSFSENTLEIVKDFIREPKISALACFRIH
jgi:hypothetical protein